MNIDLTCSTDDNYIQHCMAMLCSVFENNSKHKITVHVLHHDLSIKAQDFIRSLAGRYNNNVKFYNIDENEIGNVSLSENHPDLSVATYYRILLPSLLPENISRVLYLDCDVIVLRDISMLYNLNLENYGVAAVKDVTPGDDNHRRVMGLELDDRAFCAGVLMINLEYWRVHHSQQNMLKFLKKMSGKLVMEDQDMLNHEFHKCWFQLPYKYGYTPMAIAPIDKNQKWIDIKEYVFSPSIIHYSAHVKPWLNIRIPNDKYYWKYVRLSGFPMPKKTKVSKANKKKIQKAKIRYYLNYYIRPFVPNLIEIILMDCWNLISFMLNLFRSKQTRKEFLIRLWLKKYQ